MSAMLERKVATPIAKKMGELDQDFQAWAALQPTVTRCAWCDWTCEGTAEEGRAAFLAHRKRAHPTVKPGSAAPSHASAGPASPQAEWTSADRIARAEGRERAADLAALHERRALEEGEPTGPEPDGVEPPGRGSVSPATVAAVEPASPSSSALPRTPANPYGLRRSGRGGQGCKWTPEAAVASVRDFHAREGRWPSTYDAQQAAPAQLVKVQSALNLFGGWKQLLEAARR